MKVRLGLVSALLAALVLMPGASVSAAAGALQAERVIKVLATNISGARHEKPPAGIAGDVVVGSDRLRNAVPQFGKPKGAVVGKDRYRSVFETAAVASVEVTATLPGGTIRARGRADFRLTSNVIRVVGGTGVFAGARGTAEERALPSGQTLNIYRLRGTG